MFETNSHVTKLFFFDFFFSPFSFYLTLCLRGKIRLTLNYLIFLFCLLPVPQFFHWIRIKSWWYQWSCLVRREKKCSSFSLLLLLLLKNRYYLMREEGRIKKSTLTWVIFSWGYILKWWRINKSKEEKRRNFFAFFALFFHSHFMRLQEAKLNVYCYYKSNY